MKKDPDGLYLRGLILGILLSIIVSATWPIAYSDYRSLLIFIRVAALVLASIVFEAIVCSSSD